MSQCKIIHGPPILCWDDKFRQQRESHGKKGVDCLLFGCDCSADMSWDVVICKFKGKEPPKLEELVDEDCLPLGSATQVRESISAVLPAVNWSDPMWGVLEGAGFSI